MQHQIEKKETECRGWARFPIARMLMTKERYQVHIPKWPELETHKLLYHPIHPIERPYVL